MAAHKILRRKRMADDKKIGLNFDEEMAAKSKRQAAQLKKQAEQSEEGQGRCKVYKDSEPYKTLWDNSVLVLAVVNAFAVPVELSIYEDLSENQFYAQLDLVINVVFMIDLAICFNTSYYNKEGQLVFSRKKIAENYIKGMFFIDFFSSIPYSLIGLN